MIRGLVAGPFRGDGVHHLLFVHQRLAEPRPADVEEPACAAAVAALEPRPVGGLQVRPHVHLVDPSRAAGRAVLEAVLAQENCPAPGPRMAEKQAGGVEQVRAHDLAAVGDDDAAVPAGRSATILRRDSSSRLAFSGRARAAARSPEASADFIRSLARATSLHTSACPADWAARSRTACGATAGAAANSLWPSHRPFCTQYSAARPRRRGPAGRR